MKAGASILVVVEDPRNWPLEMPGVSVVPARAYLTDPAYGEERAFRVFNLCQSYRYQSLGYYVSLLAEARGHKPMPQASTIGALGSRSLVRLVTEDLDELVQRALAPIKSDDFELSIYFGRNVAARYDRLSQRLFDLFHAPLLRAQLERHEGQWRVRTVRTIAASDIPAAHRDFVVQAAEAYFQARPRRVRRRAVPRYEIAILHDPANPEPPSNEKALRKFERAAEALDMRAELITRADLGRLAEFDGLFIRDTTAVNHYTYRAARLAAADGLVVIDDPDSILKCANKVYLAELLARHRIRAPRTLMVHRDNRREILQSLSLPCVLKQPDSAFSLGVIKVDTEEALRATVSELLEKSELIVAQEYLPTEYDWRVGILDRRPLFVCRYYMVPGHWQILQHDKGRKLAEGAHTTMTVGEAPEDVVRTALRLANLIGDGFYGVDLKQAEGRCYIIEINDNPNIDHGIEDDVLKDALYREIMGVFLRRIEARKRGSGR